MSRAPRRPAGLVLEPGRPLADQPFFRSLAHRPSRDSKAIRWLAAMNQNGETSLRVAMSPDLL